MKIRNLLFDLDGTLTDPKIGITRSIQYALNKLGLPVPNADSLSWCIGPSMSESMKILLPPNSDTQAAVQLYRERYGSLGLYENNIYPEIKETLDQLHLQGFKLFVATAKPTVFATAIIRHFELEAKFIRTYGSNLDGTFTDKSELLSLILHQEQLDAAETVMIGDRKFDIVAAKENGIKSIAVTWGYGSEKELNESMPDQIVHSPYQLLQLLIDENHK
jgi:phosphoglycolate phosphatase